MPEKIQLKTNQNNVLTAHLFHSNSIDRLLIIASATGVKQRYYQKFATVVAASGINVITFDYAGIGESLTGKVKNYQNNAADWGRHDLEAVINQGLELFPNARLTLMGHSIGGQLIGLAKSAQKADQLILVAAQSGYWKLWRGWGRYRMWTNWYIVFPLFTRLFGYLPSKRMTGMENLPGNVAWQWRNWCVSPLHFFEDESVDTSYYTSTHAKVTAFSIADDNYAPKLAVDWLTEKYSPKAKRVHWEPGAFNLSKIGHFGVFKTSFSTQLWGQLQAEIA